MTSLDIPPTWVVAACHRPDLKKMINALAVLNHPQDRVVVVANGPNPPRPGELPAWVVDYPDPEYNMSLWWNTGLDAVTSMSPGARWNVLVINADTEITSGDVTRLATALRALKLSAVGTDQHGLVPPGHVHVENRLMPVDLRLRMPGFAFMLAGEEMLRFDPQFRHWYLDDDMEWQARAANGVGIVGGTRAGHPPGGNPLTPTLARWAAEDREKFRVKWGAVPC